MSVGGENLTLGIKSIYDLKEITYLGLQMLCKYFQINKKINETVKAVKDFNPDILFMLIVPILL